jgi:hypothetical protein
LLHKDLKDLGISRCIDTEAGTEAIEGQRPDQRGHLPVTERHGPGHPPAFRSTAVAARHRTGHPAFIDKDQAVRIECFYLGAPGGPLFLIGYRVVFGCVE